MIKHCEAELGEVITASFRDPSGCLLSFDERIFRVVNQTGVADFKAFLESETFQKFSEQGSVVRTECLDDASSFHFFEKPEIKSRFAYTENLTVVEHERIPFQNFPYEWSPEMLYAAASLTLDLAESLLVEGLGLKDATPYNILFRGVQPVFVDLLSFERRDAGNPLWSALAQFERTFLFPLMVNKHFGISLAQLLTMRRDGLEPEDVYRLCGFCQRLLPPFLTNVSIPTWLGRRHNQDDAAIYEKKSLENAEKARFIVESLLNRLRKSLQKLQPQSKQKSVWSDYLDCNNNYSEAHFQAKHDFVEQSIQEFQAKKVLDVGCNTGHFSVLAAKQGASVTAIDYDPVVVGETWRRAAAENLDILPLVVDLTRPTPALGWRNQENPSFLNRARGKFDVVLMLAVIHHMLVTERIPLPEILELAAELTTDVLIIEYIAPTDSMFRRLLRGREHLFTDLTPELFEDACRRHFEIARTQHLENTDRRLYLLKKR
jgi:2-polyprenyl-3-methyl-5-hydroxy-6-metoxy-1,4-benzoquinol methylase